MLHGRFSKTASSAGELPAATVENTLLRRDFYPNTIQGRRHFSGGGDKGSRCPIAVTAQQQLQLVLLSYVRRFNSETGRIDHLWGLSKLSPGLTRPVFLVPRVVSGSGNLPVRGG